MQELLSIIKKLDLKTNKTYNHIVKILKAIVIITMAFLCILYFKNKNTLHIKSNNKNIIINEFDYSTDSFYIEFVHSVNKSPVKEYYKIDENKKIVLYKSVYYNFGAGVETNIYGDQKFEFGEDGSLIFYDLDISFNDLSYIVGTIYDHLLYVIDKNENEKNSYNLTTLFGKNSKINIYFK